MALLNLKYAHPLILPPQDSPRTATPVGYRSYDVTSHARAGNGGQLRMYYKKVKVASPRFIPDADGGRMRTHVGAGVPSLGGRGTRNRKKKGPATSQRTVL
eukprot:2213359-Pyramimonas_sp.AAC.1